MYFLKESERIHKIFLKLSKKDPQKLKIISKKVEEIMQNPQHYKNLKSPLNNWKRIHIDKNYVLCFSVNENTKIIRLEDFDHHDNIYKTNPKSL